MYLEKRPIHPDIEDMLLNNEAFQYAHLIKFERPSRPDKNGVSSTSKERYTYITDASRNVPFDDLSKDLFGTPNGSQLYIANKVLKVSSVLEQVEARANNFNLVLDGNGIGANIVADVQITAVNATTWDIVWPDIEKVLEQGFREGDKVQITILTNTYEVNIKSFRANNVLRVEKIDTNLPTGVRPDTTMSLQSEEIKSILLNKQSADYASFINREVFIYKAYFQEGSVVGEPFLLFKGIISGVSFDESDEGIVVTWNLTSHWGDFTQVRGRVTSDEFHRALDANGIPQPSSALKTSYAYDKGFSHAETSLNILAQYNVKVEKQSVKAKSGFLGLGIGAKVKVKTYYETETRNTALDFQLAAKSIPLIYGVRTIEGIPIFADTLNDNSSVVYVAYALSEGEISGLLDIYVDGNSLICNDEADYDARHAQTDDNTVQLLCRGRADRGDVLTGSFSSDTNTANFIDYYSGDSYLYTGLVHNYNYLQRYAPYVKPVDAYAGSAGIKDGESIQISTPQDITIDLFTGKPDQKASSQLVGIARAGNFKIQKDYWNNQETAEYWGPNHRLLDTAYVVVKIVIAEGETSVPDIEFVIKGKIVDCYNYDYSYAHFSKNTSENSNLFKLGSYVSLYDSNDILINNNVQIIDKWSFYDSYGTPDTRFRFSEVPNLNYDANGVPNITKFYMKDASGNKWTMVTYNYVIFSGTIGQAQTYDVTSVTDSSGDTSLNFPVANPTAGTGYGGSSFGGGTPAFSLFSQDIN